ncbi:MAG: helix-turn-helix domain-containing protein [Moraxellaceae bacterium]
MNSGHNNSRHAASVPAIYLLLLCDVSEGFGVPTSELLDIVGLTREQLLESDRMLPLAATRAATLHAYARAGHRGLGFAYARALRVTLHGPVSLIALSSNNLLEVMQALERYFSLRAPAFHLSSEAGPEFVTIKIDYPGRNDPLRPFIMELLLMGLVVMTAQILDRPQTGTEMQMQGPAPDYYAALAPHLPVPVRYQQPEFALRVPRALMEAPLRLADPNAAAMAREACERELQARQSSSAKDDVLTGRVRTVLKASNDRLPTLEEVADTLHVSTRTLKRRLQEEGRNFRALVDHVLCERAMQMLQEEGLSVSEVAYRLGYNDVSNFSRAFRRWTGQSPSDFRKER